jgi:hypothetical protein
MFLMENNIVLERPYFEHQKQCNSTTITADDNQGHANAQSQLVNAFISACGYNDAPASTRYGGCRCCCLL